MIEFLAREIPDGGVVGLMLMFVVVGVLDAFSTNRIIEAGGREMNPFVASVMAVLGDRWVLVKMGVHFGAAAAVYAYPVMVTAAPLVLVVATNAIVVANNYRVRRRQKKRAEG